MAERTLTLNIKAVSVSALSGLRTVSEQVSATVKSAMAEIDRLMEGLSRLDGVKLGGLQSEVRSTELALKSLMGTAGETANGLFDLDGRAGAAGKALRSVGAGAVKADEGLKATGSTAVTTAEALGDVRVGADGAVVGLEAVDAAGDVAGKSLSSVSRRATTTVAKLESLGAVRIDAAPVVAAADEMTAALRGTSEAALAARGAIAGTGMAAPGAGGRRVTPRSAGGFGGSVFRGAQNVAMGVTGIGLGAAIAAGRFSNEAQGVVGNTNMPAADQARMRRSVLKLMDTGSESTSLLTGYKNAYDFQYRGKDTDAILAYANRLAIGTHADPGDTAQALAGTMNAYRHMPASMAPRMGNTMHAGAVMSNMTLSQFEKNSSRSFALGSAYDISPAEVTALYATMVQHRLNPARADTQVGGLLYQIAAPSNKAAAEAKRLGISDVFNKSALSNPEVGPSGVLDRVRTAIGRLPANEQASALKSLFNNKQGGLGAQIAIGPGHNSLDRILNGPQGTKAAYAGKVDLTTPLYNQQMNQPAQQLKALQGSLRAPFIPIGDELIPIFMRLVPVVKVVAQGIVNLMSAFTRLPKTVQEAVLAFGALSAVSKVLEMGGLHVGTRALLGEKAGLTARMFVGGRAIGGAGAAAEGGGGAAMAGIGVAAASAGKGVLAFLNPMNALRPIVTALAPALKSLSGFGAFLGDIVKGLPIVTRIGAALANLSGVMALLGDALAPVVAVIGGGVGIGLLGALAGVAIAVVAFGAAWAANIGGVRDMTRKAGQEVVGFINSQFGYVKNWFTKNLPEIQKTTKTVLDAIAAFWKEHGARIVATLEAAWGVIKAVISGAIRIVLDVVKIGMEIIQGNWKGAWAAVKNLLSDAWTAIKGIVVNGAHLVGNALMLLLGVIADVGKRIWAAVVGLGKSIVAGIKTGIESAWGGLKGFLTGLGKKITDPVKQALGIASPSRVMHKIGEDVGQGLIDGIRSKSGGVMSASDSLAAAVEAVHDKYDRLRSQTTSRPGRAALDIAERGQIGLLRRRDRDSRSQFDPYLSGQSNGLQLDRAAWNGKQTTNQGFLSALQSRKSALDEWGKAHATWLRTHEQQAQKFATLETRVLAEIDLVSGRIQSGKDAISRLSGDLLGKTSDLDGKPAEYRQILASFVGDVKAGKYSRVDPAIVRGYTSALTQQIVKTDNEASDKKASFAYDQGDASSQQTLTYFKGRQDALHAAGKDYTDEWYEIATRVKELQRQIAEADRALAATARQGFEQAATDVRTQMGALKNSFDSGTLSARQYKSAIQDLQYQVDMYLAITPGAGKSPALAGMPNELQHVVIGADKAQAKADGKSIGGQFMSGVIDSAKQASTSFLEALFKGGKAMKGAGKRFLESILDGLDSAASKAIIDKIFAQIFGSEGQDKSLAKLLGGGSASSRLPASSGAQTTGLQAGAGGRSGGSGGNAALGAGLGAMLAMSMLMSKGATKQQKHSAFGALLGGVVGGIAGSYLPGGWAAGAQIGEGAGGLLGGMFAAGGNPPVGRPSIVGERGRELFVPRVPGTIVPNGPTEGILSGGNGRGGDINVHAPHTTNVYGNVTTRGDLEDIQRDRDRAFQANLRNSLGLAVSAAL